jgi:hypothetical protein
VVVVVGGCVLTVLLLLSAMEAIGADAGEDPGIE